VELLDVDIDGRSIVEVIGSGDAPEVHEALYWQFRDQWAVRKGPWKLIINVINDVPGDAMSATDRRLMLVNLDEDPGEQKNLAVENPDKVEELRDARPDWAK